MIARTPPPWQRSLSRSITRAEELLDLLGLPPETLGEAGPAREAARRFPLRVPRGFAARMVPGDARDPLLLQVLPAAAEASETPGFSLDPLGERGSLPARGLLHKYRGRVLLVVVGACGVHCRYCFRRHFPYGEESPPRGGWDEALAYVAADPEIEEVILSGGDPLAASDERLAELAARIESIGHVRRLRLHTRMPVVLPERVDDALLRWLAGGRLRPVVVVHANHPHEIDDSVRSALGRLRGAGVTLLNQAVLLAGVNDEAGTLARLSEAVFEAGALPYYLHLLDRVQGAAHFEVSEEKARRLTAELLARLPGYLVPRLVREVEGAASKVPLALESTALPVPAARIGGLRKGA